MKFNKLDVPYQWEEYWTKYPHGYTIFEALCSWLTEVNDMVDNINDINKYISEFEDRWQGEMKTEVKKLLSEWKNDGILEQLLIEVYGERLNDLGNNIKNHETIQEAVNKGGKVIIPSGVYIIDRPIFIDSNDLELVGIGDVVIKKSSSFVGDTLIRSIGDERVNVPGTLRGVSIKNIRLDGVDNTVDGVKISGFGRGCYIEDIEISNCLNAISLKDSWSFRVVGNNINNCVKGIHLEGAINAISVFCNTVRNSKHGIFAENLRGSSVISNTFELNEINCEISGSGNTITGNYFELPTGDSVVFGSNTAGFVNNVVQGNFFNNVGGKKAAIRLKSARDNEFGVNRMINVIFQYYMDVDSEVINNHFINSDPNITIFRIGDTSFGNGGGISGGNIVEQGGATIKNTLETGVQGSLAEWRISVGSNDNWARFGKIASNDDDFRFFGDTTYRFSSYVKFDNRIGFFGAEPSVQRTIPASGTLEERFESLVSSLVRYGLIKEV